MFDLARMQSVTPLQTNKPFSIRARGASSTRKHAGISTRRARNTRCVGEPSTIAKRPHRSFRWRLAPYAPHDGVPTGLHARDTSREQKSGGSRGHLRFGCTMDGDTPPWTAKMSTPVTTYDLRCASAHIRKPPGTVHALASPAKPTCARGDQRIATSREHACLPGYHKERDGGNKGPSPDAHARPRCNQLPP